ncbi:ADP-ribosylation factor-like protein 11, partial [Nibea albiflora]
CVQVILMGLDSAGKSTLLARLLTGQALVFVVDSSDPARLPEAQKVLKKVLADEKLRGIPLMVLANKKDLPNSMTIREISKQLNLPSYTDRLWEIQACSALKGLGLQQAFMSVNKLIKKS